MNTPGNTIPDNARQASTWAWVSLGANQPSPAGNPRQTVLAAMEHIAGWSRQPARRSSLWLSEPMDCPPGTLAFINAALAIVPAPGETPMGLLRRLLTLELEFGRQRDGTANAPRSLDLDLVSFGQVRSEEPALRLPHPRAHRRAFVLFPLAEIEPELRLPGQAKTVRELCAAPWIRDQRLTRLGS